MTGAALAELCLFLPSYGHSCLGSVARTRGHSMTDAQQFEAFMHNYQNMVFSTALRLVANQAEAQDISQEVFLKAYERFAELKDSPTAGGWLKTVATNMSLNHLSRYRARWSFFSEMFSGSEEDEERPYEVVADDTLEADLNRADFHELVENALNKLPPAQRVPLVLYHLEGLSYEEISAKLRVSLGKVKTDIFRARETLRKKLGNRLSQELHPA
jgi:RNA polymerase sigma-70 factor, ECF subfamily